MEFEVKLAMERQETMEKVLRDPEILGAMAESIREIPMETVYYDTPEGGLSAKKWTFRRRLEGGMPVVTLKTPSEYAGRRNEWETECEEILSAIPALIELGAPESLREVGTVVPVCGAKFLRKAVMLELSGCQAELALDEGILFRGEKQTGMRELELELKDGDPSAMLELGRRLCCDYGLYEEHRSKFYRAFTL